jgi:hypothetical protein
MAEPIWNLTTREHNVTMLVTAIGQVLFRKKKQFTCIIKKMRERERERVPGEDSS